MAAQESALRAPARSLTCDRRVENLRQEAETETKTTAETKCLMERYSQE
jgi:hypothetical protein